ncbi:MAG: hypothetical protein IPP89_06165 [Saprospiraceae bacterium]|nr:hypothetical protein [Candidatus Brachybacter algidus]MBL0118564.1 hypothetical protein [Candidatus Brachybacter algidus]
MLQITTMAHGMIIEFSIGKMSIHPANMALHYGQSIFEGLKAGKDKDGTPMLFVQKKNRNN